MQGALEQIPGCMVIGRHRSEDKFPRHPDLAYILKTVGNLSNFGDYSLFSS